MAYKIPLQDGKPISKLGEGEVWGHALPAGTTYGKNGHLLQVSQNPAHRIYYEEFGNPKGEPVIVVHGGPGGGCTLDDAKFLDQSRYRIILFDQRGCGNSTPSVASGSPEALKDNNTAALVGDMVKLRDHLGIQGKMHLFGGSWGSTLALAYAIEHPTHVKSLQMRGIFLGKNNTFNYFYQGNAATYDETKPLAQQACNEPGAYRAYLGDGSLPRRIPEAYRTPTMAKAYGEFWHNFVTVIPKEKRGDMVKAYSEIFEKQEPLSAEDRAYQLKAAQAWSLWEGLTSYLTHDPADLSKYSEPAFALNFARIENRYFMHGCYLGMKEGENPENFLGKEGNFILNNVDRLKNIPVLITHPPTDQVTMPEDAAALVKGLKKAGNKNVTLLEPICGHSRVERANAEALMKITAAAPQLTDEDKKPLREQADAKIALPPVNRTIGKAI